LRGLQGGYGEAIPMRAHVRFHPVIYQRLSTEEAMRSLSAYDATILRRITQHEWKFKTPSPESIAIERLLARGLLHAEPQGFDDQNRQVFTFTINALGRTALLCHQTLAVGVPR
jgi:hypothetical protein